MTDDDVDCRELAEETFDVIKSIQDPEKSQTLEELLVVKEELVKVRKLREDEYEIIVEVVPTVPHCSLATLIGLCIRVKLHEYLLCNYKLDVFIREEKHLNAGEITKQINDKERTSAAIENPELMKIVQQCIKERD
ncbi:cytosolic iron-sulfur assembly component 2A-like isoform X1 [Hydractinia symbiolongicarpus]|uniref:cytosolic iron-sulfur assembly component 2A-like isoform X1 n=1 Tax=Hydractinia symbiolongicarpus TaxID=13093 RepID=UPI00254F75B5|nr:cytosolic iron-sulfur assembly component 2A-like isoform X1 [Hydractinia symbiolongicarpus]